MTTNLCLLKVLKNILKIRTSHSKQGLLLALIRVLNTCSFEDPYICT